MSSIISFHPEKYSDLQHVLRGLTLDAQNSANVTKTSTDANKLPSFKSSGNES